jgi:AcrR family transcriptional regulator
MPGSPRGEVESERFEPNALGDLPPELALSRLPAGRHGLPPSFVARNQRRRLIAAMLLALARHGYPATTIGHVTREAGVSRAAFYRQFESKEECFLATHDLAAEWLCERVERSVAECGAWPAQVRVGVSEGLRLLGANPEVAHLIAVESLQAGPAARARRQACLARLAGALCAGRPNQAEVPFDLDEMLLAGALSHIAFQVDSGRAEQLPEMTAELVQYLLIPYLEPGETRRIAEEAA